MAAGKPVIGKRGVGTDEYIVANAQTIPQLHAALDGDAVTNDDVILDKTVRTNIAVLTDLGAGQHDDELPDTRARTNGGGLDVRQSVNKRGGHEIS